MAPKRSYCERAGRGEGDGYRAGSGRETRRPDRKSKRRLGRGTGANRSR